MTGNLRKYEDYLHFLPEEEQKAMKEALSLEETPESAAITVIRQMNRSRSQIPGEERRLKRAQKPL